MSENRILTSHVGSLVRPEPFAALLKQKAEGQAVENFDTALKSAVRDVVKRQVEIGIDIVSDGEFGKGIGWEQYVITSGIHRDTWCIRRTPGSPLRVKRT